MKGFGKPSDISVEFMKIPFRNEFLKASKMNYWGIVTVKLREHAM